MPMAMGFVSPSHPLRRESAEERRAYMIENPVRADLVQRACDWPYGGEVFKPVLVLGLLMYRHTGHAGA